MRGVGNGSVRQRRGGAEPENNVPVIPRRRGKIAGLGRGERLLHFAFAEGLPHPTNHFRGADIHDTADQIDAVDRLRVPPPYERAGDTLALEVDGPRGAVKLAFFGGIGHGQIRPPDVSTGNRLKIASAEDLLALKLATIQQRLEAKDYLDICALLRSGLSLEAALGHLEALHPLVTNAMITLKTLVYFSGGDLATLPEDVKRDLESAVRGVRDAIPFPGKKAEIGSLD